MSTRIVPRLLVIFGIFIIIIGAVLNQWTLARLLTSDGQIGGQSERLLITAINVILILVGIALIVWRNHKSAQKLLFFSLYCLVIFVAFDYLLYFMAPILPETMVGWMSPQAQRRYLEANPDVTNYVYDGPVRYGKTGELVDYGAEGDALGYRNPRDYLASVDNLDLLLIGDSFTWGTAELTLADHMRVLLPENTTYSVGMPGNGITQWRYHYERYMDLSPVDSGPDIVVLNFYGGNDVTDTHLAAGLIEKEGQLSSADYNAFINYQFLAPSTRRSFQIPKPPELLFITSFLLSSGGSEPEVVVAANESVHPVSQMNLFEETDPLLFDDVIVGEIELAVAAIRDRDPDTTIVLAYIAPASVLYADILTECAYCLDDVNRQRQNSARLAELAAEFDILFHDPTAQLAETAHSEILWADNAHYSTAGYEAYAELLATFLSEVE